jgi:hypothetical protein
LVLLVVAGVGAGLAGCRTTQVSSGTGASTAPAAPTEPARPGFVPAGSPLQVRLNQQLGTQTSHEGDRFTATVQSALTAPDGAVVVPAGTVVTGKISQLHRSERVGDQAAIGLDFDSIRVAGQETALDADVVDTKVKGQADRGRAGKGAAIGGAGGAVLGAIIGRGLGGAVVGGLLGAGAGTLIGLGTGDVDPKLPAGTELSLRTTAPAKVALVRTGGPT